MLQIIHTIIISYFYQKVKDYLNSKYVYEKLISICTYCIESACASNSIGEIDVGNTPLNSTSFTTLLWDDKIKRVASTFKSSEFLDWDTC